MKVKILTLLFLFLSIIDFFNLRSQTIEKNEILIKNIKTKILEDRSILLEWTPVITGEETEIIIGKSNSPIDTIDKFYMADSLGKYRYKRENPLTIFKDQNKEESLAYYAIAVVNSLKKKEIILIADQNYTTKPSNSSEVPKTESIIPVTPKTASHITGLIYEVVGEDILLKWKAAEYAKETETIYNVYSSIEPILYDDLTEAENIKKLNSITHPNTSYLIKGGGKRDQTVYYGVTVQIKDTPERFDLKESDSCIKIEKKISPVIISNKVQELDEDDDGYAQKKEIKPANIETKKEPETKTVVDNKPITENKVVDNKPIDTKKTEEKTLVVIAINEPKSISIETPSNENQKKKVDKDLKQFEDAELEFEFIKINYFEKRRFIASEIALKQHIKRSLNSEKMARGKFYLAMSHYYRGDFFRTINLLKSSEVKKHIDKDQIEYFAQKCFEYSGKWHLQN